MKEFENFYGHYYSSMCKVKDAVTKHIHSLDTTLKIVSRIKTPQSMCDKLKKDGFPVTADSAIINESDAIGVRVISSSINEVYEILDYINHSSVFHVINIKDFIKNPKKSGYMSLHVIVKLYDYPDLKIEIQLRTAIMDCWASLEHLVRYKQVEEFTPEILDLLNTYKTEAMKEIAEFGH